MKSWRRELIELIVPSLPDYGRNPTVLVGCRSSDIFYDVCEVDILVFDSDNVGVEHVPMKDGLVEIHRVSESATQIAREKPNFVTHAQPLHDPHLTLGGIFGGFAAKFRQKWVKDEIIDSMTLLGRAKTCKQAGDLDSGLLWLMASTYRLIGAMLVHAGLSQSPSHFMTTLKAQGETLSRGFYALSAEILGLNIAEKLPVVRRLEMLETTLEKRHVAEVQFRLTRRKVSFLNENEMFVEAYSLLGYHLLESLGLFVPMLPPIKAPEAYKVGVPTSVKRKAFPHQEEPFEDLAHKLEETITETWKLARTSKLPSNC